MKIKNMDGFYSGIIFIFTGILEITLDLVFFAEIYGFLDIIVYYAMIVGCILMVLGISYVYASLKREKIIKEKNPSKTDDIGMVIFFSAFIVFCIILIHVWMPYVEVFIIIFPLELFVILGILKLSLNILLNKEGYD